MKVLEGKFETKEEKVYTPYFFVHTSSDSFRTEFIGEKYFPLLVLVPFEVYKSFSVRIVN